MFDKCRQARNFKTNVPKTLDLKSSSKQIFSEKLGASEWANYKVTDSFLAVSPSNLIFRYGSNFYNPEKCKLKYQSKQTNGW